MSRDGGLNVRKRIKRLLLRVFSDAWFYWPAFVVAPKMLGLSHISWGLALLLPFLATVSVLILIFSAGGVVGAVKMIKRKHRARKRDRRIIAQAKASGAWYEFPTPLGGRALELYAWHEFKIKRRPEETDAELRKRCDAKTFVSLIVGEAEKALEKCGGAE